MAETWRRVQASPYYQQLIRKNGGFSNLGNDPEWHRWFQSIYRQIERERGIGK